MRHTYTRNERRKAVNYAKRNSIQKAADKWGVSYATICNWKSALGADTAEVKTTKPVVTEDDQRWQQMQYEYKRLKTENEFLKKSVAYFANQAWSAA